MSLRLASRLHAAKLDHERGATAVEYGLLIALIALIIVGAVTLLGEGLRDTFNEVRSEVPG